MDQLSETISMSLGGRGERLFERNLDAGEKVLAKLKGQFGQGLVITDKHLYILKWGFMAGSVFGGRCIVYPFRNISSVKITTSIASGVLEVVTPGNQDAKKTYWNLNQNGALKADDAVAFLRRDFKVFQKASSICRDKIAETHTH